MLTVMVRKCINVAELIKRLLTTLYSIEFDSKTSMNGEQSRIWTQPVVTYFNVFKKHSPSENKTMYEKPLPEVHINAEKRSICSYYVNIIHQKMLTHTHTHTHTQHY
jgi:hypothetical protein